MKAVLGIDAAWTTSQPSGVALARHNGHGWELLLASPSYQDFIDGRGRWDGERPTGSTPNAVEIIAAGHRMAGADIGVVAIDMPLSRTPITSRRTSDNLVSSAYGSRKCGTHTPSASRPGLISDVLRTGFEAEGYPLATEEIQKPALIEVYPHPALVELADANERLRYKHAKARAYWPADPPTARRDNLIAVWREIIDLVDERIAGTRSALSIPDAGQPGFRMKAFEDMLDAVVCAWVAIEFLEGRAIAYGDQDSAIWVPVRSGKFGLGRAAPCSASANA
jgi:predicted RNase H-like nuclease